MNIVIEKAKPYDAEAILEYLFKAGSETDNLTFGAEGIGFSKEEEAKYIAELENSNDSIMLIAKHGKKVLADASLHRLPRRMSHRGEIGLCVLKEYWGQGIGSALLGEIFDFAKKNNFEILELQVRSDNERAVRLYEKFGFKKIGNHPSFFKVKEESVPFYYMILNLK